MENNITIKLRRYSCILSLVCLGLLPLVGFSQTTNVHSDIKSISDEVSATNIIHSTVEKPYGNNLSSINTGILNEAWGVILTWFITIGFLVYKHKKVMEVGMWFLSLIKWLLGKREKRGEQLSGAKNIANNGDGAMISPIINGNGNDVKITYNAQLDKRQNVKDGSKKDVVSQKYQRRDVVKAGKRNKAELDSWLMTWFIAQGFQRLKTIDNVKVRCPKGRTIIYVIDDKDGKRYEKGLNDLGYNAVQSFLRCPDDNELGKCAIIIFDVCGVGNSAGSDGFALAKHYKDINPLKKVIVRSGYLTKYQEENKGSLDAVLDKSRDMCEQVDPLLREYVAIVGNPIEMWKNARSKLLRTYNLKEVALLEHKYVQILNSLADTLGDLPGDWMSEINNRLGVQIF